MKSPVLHLGSLGLLLACSGCWSNETGNLAASELGDLRYAPSPRSPFSAELDAACGPGGLTAHGATYFRRLPYLQKVTDSRATVMWTSPSPVAAQVTAVSAQLMPSSTDVSPDVPEPTGATTKVATVDASAAPEGAVQWLVDLEGLEPDTIYCYQLADDGGAITLPMGFRTAPRPDSTEPVRFVTLGDLGKRAVDQWAVAQQLRGVEYDFGLINGDVAYDDGRLDEIERNYFAVYGDILAKVPFFAATGNHDYRTADALPFRQSFALFDNGGPAGLERWYSFDWGPVHVAVLDTERLDVIQHDWLDADLAANELPWVVVIGHRPTFSSGKHGSDPSMQLLFRPLFEKHQVQLVLAGHDHDYERIHPQNGVTYLVSGAGGVGTRDVGHSEFTAFSEAVSHFVYVVIENEELTAYAIDATGQDFDTVRIPR